MFNNIEDAYKVLAKAIVISAAEEYKRNRFIIDTINKRSYGDEERRYKALNRAKREVINVDTFFHSEWFRTLAELDGEKAFIALKNTYINEYYPARMIEEKWV